MGNQQPRAPTNERPDGLEGDHAPGSQIATAAPTNKLDNLIPMDPSGWPSAQFDAIPCVKDTQRGVVAKGSIDYALFATITLAAEFDHDTVQRAVARVPHIAEETARIATRYYPDGAQKPRVVALVGICDKLCRQWDPHPPHEMRPFVDKRATPTNSVCQSENKRNEDRKGKERQANSDEEEAEDGDILFPAMKGGELFLMVKSDRVDLCYIATKMFLDALGHCNVHSDHQTIGFRYMGGRDLTGFIDGTRNPDHLLRALVDEVVIFPGDGDRDERHVGGCYMFAGRFVHNLRKFFGLSDNERSDIVGRHYDVDRPHQGFDSRLENPRLGGEGRECDAEHNADLPARPAPRNSHAQLAFGSMYRQAYPYRHYEEEGLYFTAYSRFLSEIDTAINRMCGHFGTGRDNLLSITRAAECNYYYVPSLNELSELSKGAEVIPLPLADGTVEGCDASSNGADDRRVRIEIEYCTNCGYQSIFLEKKRTLESVAPNVVVIGNPTMPRLAAFEITVAGGPVLWSKLGHKDGRNNFDHVFPSNDHLALQLKKHLGLATEDDAS